LATFTLLLLLVRMVFKRLLGRDLGRTADKLTPKAATGSLMM